MESRLRGRRLLLLAIIAGALGTVVIVDAWWQFISTFSYYCQSVCVVRNGVVFFGNSSNGGVYAYYVVPSQTYADILFAITFTYVFSLFFFFLYLASPGRITKSFPTATTIVVASFLLSILIHFPGSPLNGLMGTGGYSDIISFWSRYGVNQGKAPYFQYPLEYPVLAGGLLCLASVTRNLFSYSFVMFAGAFASMLASLSFTYGLLKIRKGSERRLLWFFALTPVFAYFSIYNFDWFGTALFMGALYLFFEGKTEASGALLGLSAAARLFPVLALPFMLRQTERRFSLTLGAIAGWAVPNAFVFFANPSGWLGTYTYVQAYPVEDSWVGLLPLSRIVGIVILGLFLIFVWKRKLGVIESSLLALVGFIATNYISPPQYLIVLLPLCVLVEVNYWLFLSANILDVAIIQLFYSFGPDPFAPSSPIQWISYFRQVVLVAMGLVWLRFNGRRPLTTSHSGELTTNPSPLHLLVGKKGKEQGN